MKIKILTSKSSWLYKNRKKIKYKNYWKNKKIITSYKDIQSNFDLTVMLSYYKIIPSKYLNNTKYNLVVHESDLPKGRGFSPLFHQIINGKTWITFSLFECLKNMDSGKIYFKKKFYFSPTLIYEEIKNHQINCALKLLDIFLKKLKNKKKLIKGKDQKGNATFFKKLKNETSEININKTLDSQINILRTRDNDNFPSYFYYKKRKYILKLF